MKKFLNKLIGLLKEYGIAIFIVVPIINIISMAPVFGIAGLINRYNLMDIKSYGFYSLIIRLIVVFTVIVTTLMFILLRIKEKNYKTPIRIGATFYAAFAFMMAYKGYLENISFDSLLTSSLLSMDFSELLFDMAFAFAFVACNVFIISTYTVCALIVKFKDKEKKKSKS